MTAPHIVPLLDRLDSAGNVLIAGCGGGFDVYAGMPIAAYLASSGRSVIYANLSFSNLEESGCEKVDPITGQSTPGRGTCRIFRKDGSQNGSPAVSWRLQFTPLPDPACAPSATPTRRS